MTNLISTAIIVAALAMLVPNNAAEAVVTHYISAPITLSAFAQQASVGAMTAMNTAAPDPSVAWLISLGFLGLIAARRLRAE